MALAQFWPLNKVTDGDRWKAENLFVRLGIVAHAAFLYTGFRPHAKPRRSFSSRFSLDQLVHRDGGGDTIEMRLFRRRYVTLHTCIVRNGRRYHERQTRFYSGDLVKALSSSDVDETARVLKTPRSAASWLWQLLAGELCQDLFLDACRMNGIPVTGFASLPGDSAKDLARVECASKELRQLVAEHDAYLWKPKYEYIYHYQCPLCRRSDDSDDEKLSWKRKYLKAKRCCRNIFCRLQFSLSKRIRKGRLLGYSSVPATDAPIMRRPTSRRKIPAVTIVPVAHGSLLNPAPKLKGKHDFAVQSNGYRRRHGAGAIHSPSSRYRWKHR